ncbi:uncharacterized protein PFL1_04150 [Pseudozyma flocculosa PF-1]|uniref:Glycoside hydrolase family 5 protein n=2 Tax=Pseudozyma flocculosa TaxID=84751 RepID=A0A5C3ET01_9BASI|nr:uncharacterized protein PFL1_04150 [Pseudozyma flocculosa PF-1]EPQ28323.1 hypothetical protein PFL1_04150 [Pseudozyma flocculosa PF-1]SPO35473.1 uncharacterized protein PSFLO_00944 [Pseudozyma flocculosa]
MSEAQTKAATYAAHDLSHAALGHGPLRVRGNRFLDQHGRTLLLRGINVSGASKLPTTPNGLSHLSQGFYSHRSVSFIGRPFPLDQAPLHLARLKAWGLTLVRLLVTWESISHAGPNPNTDLDHDYIHYLTQLIQLMPKYGIKCFVCAHQDVWSRFSGGSGAPGWTFEAAGLDIHAFTQTGAAYVHSQDELRRATAKANKAEPSGPFLWPSGYQKLAASTMATLFWAGDAFAPDLVCTRTALDGSGRHEVVSIQTFLQDAYFEAFGRLSDALSGLEACIGFEAMNEPHRGLVNLHSFYKWNYDTDLHIGHYPTLAEALALGSGHAQKVHYYVKTWPMPTRISHRSLLDPQGRSAWLPADVVSAQGGVDRPKGMGRCVWKAHGVWEWNDTKQAAVILQHSYFDEDHRKGREGQRVEWYRDFYTPFLKRFHQRVNRKASSNLSFLEPIPNEFMPPWKPAAALDEEAARALREAATAQSYAAKTLLEEERPSNLVYAPHFYDLNVLFGKTHAWMSVNVQGLSRGMFVLKALYFGADGLRKNYRTQLANIVRYARASLGALPIVIGEVGIPYDINKRLAFATGDFSKQRELMDALIGAMEDNLLHFTLWNYNPDNRIEYGDGWNNEDFSLTNGGSDTGLPVKHDFRNHSFEGDELFRGGRVLDVVIRPYAAKVAGQPLKTQWDQRTLRYEFEWGNVPSSATDDDAGVDEATDRKRRTTEIFLPAYHYRGKEFSVTVSDGEYTLDAENQTLYIVHANREPFVKHRATIELRDERAHMLQRVRERRRHVGSRSPLPVSLELWLESWTVSQVLSISIVVLVALVGIVAIDQHVVATLER